MNNKEKMKIITEVFCDVLGKYALMFADKIPAKYVELEKGEYIYGEIYFYGDRKGKIYMVTRSDFSNILNTNILGNLNEIVIDNIYDSFKEFLNIMCGEFLLSFFGKKMLFKIDSPKITTISLEETIEYIEKVDYIFTAESIPVIVDVDIINNNMD